MLAQSIGSLHQKHEKMEKDLVRFVEMSIEKAKGHMTDDLKGHKNTIEMSFREIKKTYEEYDQKTHSKTENISKGLQKELKDKIDSIYKDIETMSKKMDQRPTTWGGASIITYLNGAIISPQNLYNQINWIMGPGLSASAVNNNQTQQVDVTLSASGFLGISIFNEIVSGSGTSFSLSINPILGTQRIYANGQRLTPGIDYTISGNILTMTSSWSAGTVIADYEVTASSSNEIFNEVVSGSGTTFTLANIPVIGTQQVYAIGQRLTPGIDYTISGDTITTSTSFSAGDILSDYNY